MPWIRTRLAACLLTLGCASVGSTSPDTPTAVGERHWTRDLIDPVSAPLNFETPFIHSSVRPFTMRHAFPESSFFGGGRLDVYAAQVRVALTDRLAFIATKDGRADWDADVGPDTIGDLDLAAGLKYAIVDDPENGEIVTVGLVYEGTQGDAKIFQGNGSGVYRPFVSAGWDLGETNVIAALGVSVPIDGDAESQILDYHLHVDYEYSENFFPLFEINGLHYMNGGRALPVNFEAVDYGNLGSTGVAGNDIITAALGFRYKVTEDGHLGFAYEKPITSRQDIFDDRFTLDYTLRF